ncbi:hypothetical protein ACFOMD_05425 [Sphingoaurantiacus capsulatus]|uniref:Uncharacterized protein n=1 Tax=Sphingoaurantiacus capsulatus TaxID=1771310 RepID=A0ABV7X776_9SPHN
MTVPENVAKRRFLTLQLFRLAGLIVAAAGGLVWQTDRLTPYPMPGYGKALLALGLFMMMVVPPILRRAWRSPLNDR